MNFNKKGLVRNVALGFCAVYILSFIIYYLGNFIFTETNVFLYIDIFADRLIFFLLPSISALVALIISAFSDKILSAYIAMMLSALPRLVYFIPYFYLENMNEGIESLEAFLFALLFSLGDVLLYYILTVIIFFAIKLVIRVRAGKIVSLSYYLKDKTTLNISDPISCSILFISFAAFLYYFIMEIINTVSFIISYSFNFTIPELIYAVFSYIYIVMLLFVYHTVLSFVKNKIIEKRLQL